NVRDWLHVLDHCRALDLVIDRGVNGEVYNIGGGNEVTNLDLTHAILRHSGKPTSLIKPVADRKGHDRRYSLGTAKLRGMGSRPAWRTRSRGIAPTPGGGGRSRSVTRSSRRTTRSSTVDNSDSWSPPPGHVFGPRNRRCWFCRQPFARTARTRRRRHRRLVPA